MSTVAFLITSAYQVYHYKQIARHLPETAAVIEVRDKDFGLSEEFVARHMPDSVIDTVPQKDLNSIDGRYEVIVCQTPILPLQFLTKSRIVAQQYSLAKERYQYGIWRAQADLNLMYGPYSAAQIAGFSQVRAVGNPLLDDYFNGPEPERRSFASGRPERARLLYMPTYGELSSAATVLPHLAGLEADITVKAHHAEDRSLFEGLGDHVRVVYAEADAAALFREHDGVISDFSGAAFDALATGLPTVLAGSADPSAGDFARLSDEEQEQVLLADVTARWTPGEDDLFGAFTSAEGLLGSTAYKELRERLWTNRGTAGRACAEAIEELIEHGPEPHFGAEQIRTTVRRYITSNRQLNSKLSASRAGTVPIGGKPPLLSRARFGLAYRRLTRLAKRSELAVRLARFIRRRLRSRRMDNFEIDPSVPAGPADRREQVVSLLEPALTARGVQVMRDEPLNGCDVGLFHDDKRRLLKALREVAETEPRLRVRIGSEWKVIEHIGLAELHLQDLLVADWLEIGLPVEHSKYKLGYAGYAKILFIAHDEQKNRYLTTKKVANRPDWTAVARRALASERPGPLSGEAAPHAAGPIDVVYTWVDSNDPAWQEQRHEFDSAFEVHNVSANNAERYADRNELRYSLRALNLFAPFVRNIYIVTADQHPHWLAGDHPKVQVVSHRDIFPEPSDLPTFNSHAIEACLHRIPGLSENFVYFNDDVFVGREVTEDDFYTMTGQAKVRLSPSQFVYEDRPEPDAIPTDWATYNSVQLLQSGFGLTPRRRVKHVPLVLKKSVMEEIEAKYPAEVKQTRSARFRSTTDIALPSMFAQYYGMATGRAVEWPGERKEYVYLDTGRHDSHDRLQRIMHSPTKFFCVNTTRHTEVDLDQQARNLRAFFTDAFPTPAPWETRHNSE
ncbi:hypothetical protein GCM10029992_03690 [Glycomyces albus]